MYNIKHNGRAAAVLEHVRRARTLGRRAYLRICRENFEPAQALIESGFVEPTKTNRGETRYRLTEDGRGALAAYAAFVELARAGAYGCGCFG